MNLSSKCQPSPSSRSNVTDRNKQLPSHATSRSTSAASSSWTLVRSFLFSKLFAKLRNNDVEPTHCFSRSAVASEIVHGLDFDESVHAEAETRLSLRGLAENNHSSCPMCCAVMKQQWPCNGPSQWSYPRGFACRRCLRTSM